MGRSSPKWLIICQYVKCDVKPCYTVPSQLIVHIVDAVSFMLLWYLCDLMLVLLYIRDVLTGMNILKIRQAQWRSSTTAHTTPTQPVWCIICWDLSRSRLFTFSCKAAGRTDAFCQWMFIVCWWVWWICGVKLKDKFVSDWQCGHIILYNIL